MLAVGDRAPSFVLPDQDGAPFRLEEALARGPVVVFFYPKDHTLGCTREVCAFRDEHEDFAAAGATVVGISSDDVASHASFAGRHDLPYRLLADEGGRVRGAFGVGKAWLGLFEGRVTFVIDGEGVVRHVFSSLSRASEHAAQALATLRRLVAA